MIKIRVAILEGRFLSWQSGQSEKFSKSPDWLEKSRPSKKALLFWSCKQAICPLLRARIRLKYSATVAFKLKEDKDGKNKQTFKILFKNKVQYW